MLPFQGRSPQPDDQNGSIQFCKLFPGDSHSLQRWPELLLRWLNKPAASLISFRFTLSLFGLGADGLWRTRLEGLAEKQFSKRTPGISALA